MVEKSRFGLRGKKNQVGPSKVLVDAGVFRWSIGGLRTGIPRGAPRVNVTVLLTVGERIRLRMSTAIRILLQRMPSSAEDSGGGGRVECYTPGIGVRHLRGAPRVRRPLK